VGRDQAYLNRPWVRARTIHVSAGEVGLLDFGISQARRDALYQRGYDAAAAFLATFDWDAYRERFRGAVGAFGS
jgi:NTE family protein